MFHNKTTEDNTSEESSGNSKSRLPFTRGLLRWSCEDLAGAIKLVLTVNMHNKTHGTRDKQ